MAARTTHLLVVTRGRNPTFDYYLRPRLEAGAVPWSLAESEGGAARLHELLQEHEGGLFVVICRYLDADWAEALEARRDALSGLALFDDDDIPAALADEALPEAYRRRLWHLRGAWDGRLRELAPHRWVSTRVLAEQQAGQPVAWLPPLPLPGEERVRRYRRRPFRYGYHATASHAAEVRWLQPIVGAVQAERGDWAFELIGDVQAAESFRELPRVSVLPPCSWLRYRRRARWRRMHLGLVPFDERPVNRARAEVKLFDYARQGAVVMADARCPWRRWLESDDAVLWVEPSPAAWVERLMTLEAEDLVRPWEAMKSLLLRRRNSLTALPVD